MGLLPPRIFASLVLSLTSSANAQSVWNKTTGNWISNANWNPAVVPVSSSSTVLSFGGNTSYAATNDIGNFSLNQLRFINSAGTVTLNGSPTTNALDFLNSTSTASLAAITLAGAGSATISAPIIWGGEGLVTKSGTGTLLLNGTQTYTNGTKQTFINSGTGAGAITLADGITYTNSGTNTGLVLNLTNNNSTANTFNIGDTGGLANVTFNIGGTGTVRFSGTVGDLFSDTAVLNVSSGATFDFNGNAETMGPISGAGTIRQTLGITVDPTSAAAGYHVFSGKMTGTGGFLNVSDVAETLVLSGSTSDYTGATAVLAGRLIVAANAPHGSAGALGNTASDVLVGHTSGTGAASLLSDSAGVSIGRNIRLQTGNTGTATVGGLNSTGTVTYSGNLTLGTDSAAAKGVTISAAKGGTVEFTGNLLRATSATGATDTLTVTGGGTVALRGSNTFTGASTVNAGTLLLDHSTNNGGKLSSTASLILNGGSLSFTGSGTASSTVAVSDLVLGNSVAPFGGGGRIAVTSGMDQNATLILVGITRHTGATVDFAPVSGGSGGTIISTATPNHSANILGPYATFQLNDWAVNDGAGNVTNLAAGDYFSSFGPGQHTSLSADSALAGGGATTNTLRLTTAAALTFAAPADTLTLENGGLLVASTAGATSIGTTGTRGNIAPTTGELIVHQQCASGSLTINSVIGGTTLTKSGDGTLALTGTNTYTGSTIINGGTVSVTASGNLGATAAAVIIHGGTLAAPSGSFSSFSSTTHPITIGPSGGTFNFTANVTTQGGGLSGTGTLTKTGSGIWSVGSNASSFNGPIVISAGSLRMNSPQFNNVASITIADGGTFEVNDDAVGTFSLANGGRFIVHGNGAGGNGAIRLTDQTPGTAGASDPITTLDREIALQATSRLQVDNGTAPGSLSQLILTGNVTGSGALVKSGAGALVLTARDNTYSGGTTIEAGTLRIDLGNDRLPTGTTVTLGAGSNSGTLQLNGFSQTIAGLATSGAGTSNAVIGGSAAVTSLLALNVASGNQTYGGTLGGTGASDTAANNNLAFIKDGAGQLTLTGSNNYTGPTAVNSGVLEVSGGISATTQVNLNGGTLLLGAFNVINNSAAVSFGGGTFKTGGFSEGDAATAGLGALTLSATSVLDFGAGTGSQLWFAGLRAHVAGSLAILNWSGTPGQAGGASNDRLMFAGDDAARQIFEGAFASSHISFDGLQGYAAIQFDAGHFEIVPIPEPASTGLLSAAGLLGLIGYRERRRFAKRHAQPEARNES